MRSIWPWVCGALLAGCGGGESIDFYQVTSIETDNGAGTHFSGTYAVTLEYTSDGCAGHSELGIPARGTEVALDVEVTHAEGAIEFGTIEVALRGGVSIESDFEAGGADIRSAGDWQDNILRMVYLTGRFEGPDSFTGRGQERLTGSLGKETVDCAFTFTVSGLRKEV
jgi:hypothetical protein